MRTLHGRPLVAALAVVLLTSSVRAQAPPVASDNVEQLTRGPVHEAFGQPVSFNPTAGFIAPKAPPEAVEEVAPDQKPDGDDVAWISGYWSWDDEAKDFIWVSGFWRTIPPGRTWVPGYWNKTTEGHQWVSGYWGAEASTEVTYLPAPPESLENGPVGDAPTAEAIWVPGCWLWQPTNRYAWRGGYWGAAYSDWVYTSPHYEWTPAGHVFVDGYYDYPFERRGLLFAPVSFRNYRPGFAYTPSLVLDTRFLSIALFTRPRYQHYYFGDYYAANYSRAGIYPWYAWHNTRSGYDPLFAHYDFVSSRRNPRWEADLRQTYASRRDNEALRPARTYAALSTQIRASNATAASQLTIARPLSDATARDFPTPVVKVDAKRAETIKQNAKSVRDYREERVKAEAKVMNDNPTKGTPRTAPVQTKAPQAPTLVPPMPKGTAPRVRVPEAQQTPKVDAKPPAPPKTRLPNPEDVMKPDFTRPRPPVAQPPVKKEAPPAKTPPPKPKGKGKDD